MLILYSEVLIASEIYVRLTMPKNKAFLIPAFCLRISCDKIEASIKLRKILANYKIAQTEFSLKHLPPSGFLGLPWLLFNS